MNDEYLTQALQVISDRNLLVNLASKRATEISRGARPLVELPEHTTPLDVALYEIGQGKVKPGKA